ncbi:MAG: N-acetylmuramidase domain-containing protein [Caldilineaceae bacterium]
MNKRTRQHAGQYLNVLSGRAISLDPDDEPVLISPDLLPDYIYGLHEPGGEHLMKEAGRIGWVLQLAEIGLDGGTDDADCSKLAADGFGVVTRLNHGYGSAGTLPTPDKYPEFAQSAARFVARSKGCHIWIVGNEPNHEQERPNGEPIFPIQYATAYRLVRAAIRSVPGHEDDQVLVAGSAPWNAQTTYASNVRGDWIRYFIDVMELLGDKEVDGFAIHTYTHDLNPQQITGDYFHTQPGYTHLRNEFRTYRDYMAAIPERFRHLPVLITETDPTTRHQGWNPGTNVGWVQTAYEEIAKWNADPENQPIQALILYRWPLIPDQPEWSISDRPGIIEDFEDALRTEPAKAFMVRQPNVPEPHVAVPPDTLLPEDEQWQGSVAASLGVNQRTGPGIENPIIQALPFATLVTVLAEVDEWLYVDALSQQGYVNGEFILRQEEGDPEAPPGGFLRERDELMQHVLPAPEQISVDPDSSTWTERVIMRTWNEYGSLIETVSEMLGIDPAVAVAVLAVESGGISFMDDGRMRIRFENHIFFEEYGRLNPDEFAKYLRFDVARPWEGHYWRQSPEHAWRYFHGDHDEEWTVFNMARTKFSPHSAKLSISMGLAQIMGFNHQTVGYDSVEEMFVSFRDSANAQVLGFFDFVRGDPLRVWALQHKDYLAFATSYNGSGQAEHYAALVEDGVNAFARLRSQPPPKSDDDPPQPELFVPPISPDLSKTDPELYAAWREHIMQGFKNNQEMFDRILRSFMVPYNSTVRMYRTLFFVGLASFIAAVAMSIWTHDAWFALIFGGMSVASFITFFLSRPLRSLEENLNYITWLGVIYNSYWARLLYALNYETVQADLKEITADFVAQIERLIERNNATREDRGSDKPGSTD